MAGINTVNGRFAIFCKPDNLSVVRLRAEAKDAQGNPVAIERDLSWENAKALFFNHAHTCKDRDNLWIWYLDGTTWKPIKQDGKGGFSI